jgi:SSS family solute:Na+ symporter
MTGAGPAKALDQAVGLQTLDWVLIALYALSTIGLGLYFSRRQKSMQEYFTGGGNMNPILIGVSLFATLLSTISYLSVPGEAAGKGPVNLIAMLGLPVVFCVVGFLMLPIYMKTRVTSAYELLEEKLGVGLRLLGATMFLALRLVWMTLLVYLASEAMTVMMGLDPKWIPVVAAVTGVVAVIYTSLGGLQAVVITDLLQTVLLFAGAVLVVLTVTIDFGGFGWFPTAWHANWDSQPMLPIEDGAVSFKLRISGLGALLSSTIWYIATLGGDQTTVQRFMATSDARAARKALATQLIVGATVSLTLCAVGFALLAYFEKHFDQLPDSIKLKEDADKLFPHYIAYHLPVGVSGLVVSAMFAAAMSSIDSGVNSVTAVVLKDFIGRFRKTKITERGQLKLARFLAFTIGGIVVLSSTLMRFIQGNITEMTGKTVNLLTVPIFGLFFFALFVKNPRPWAVWAGVISGTVTAVVIAFSGPLTYLLFDQFGIKPEVFGTELIEITDKVTGEIRSSCNDPISFQWISPMALAVNIAVGYAGCWIGNLVRPPAETNS